MIEKLKLFLAVVFLIAFNDIGSVTPKVFEKVLSSYFWGPHTTYQKGISWHYVQMVVDGYKPQ